MRPNKAPANKQRRKSGYKIFKNPFNIQIHTTRITYTYTRSHTHSHGSYFIYIYHKIYPQYKYIDFYTWSILSIFCVLCANIWSVNITENLFAIIISNSIICANWWTRLKTRISMALGWSVCVALDLFKTRWRNYEYFNSSMYERCLVSSWFNSNKFSVAFLLLNFYHTVW